MFYYAEKSDVCEKQYEFRKKSKKNQEFLRKTPKSLLLKII